MARHGGFLVQSSFGAVGHLELVAPSPLGGMAHSWRDNDDVSYTWHGSEYFGDGDVLALSLVQSSFGGNLEVVLRQGASLSHCYRSVTDTGQRVWSVPSAFATGVAGNPSLVQSPGPGNRNFEVVAPLVGGGIGHWYRDNNNPALPWTGPQVFATELGAVGAVCLVHSTLADDLEVVARVGDADPAETPLEPGALATLVEMVETKAVTIGAARQVLDRLVSEGGDPSSIVAAEGLGAMDGEDQLAEIVGAAIAAEPEAAERLRQGNERAVGPIVGRVMRETKGRADGGEVTRLIRQQLGV